MIIFRSAIFNMLLIFLTLCLGFLGLPLLAGPRVWTCYLRDFWIYLIIRILKIVVGLEHKIEGLENIPDGAYIVASKHQSAWETLALHTIFPDLSIVLKRELLKLPLLGLFIMKVGMVPIDRGGGRKALKSMINAAKSFSQAGRPVLIFPQGTRAAPGEKLEYHTGVFALYRAIDIPLVPVALNSGSFWSRQAFIKRQGIITVKILPAISPGLDRRLFMEELEKTLETATKELESNIIWN